MLKNLDKVEEELKKKNGEVKVTGYDSVKWNLSTNNYLLEGLLIIVQEKCRSLL